MNKEVWQRIQNALDKKPKRVFLFPYGPRGREIFNYIKDNYKGVEIQKVDNGLCIDNKDVISFSEMIKEIDMRSDDDLLILTSDSLFIYREVQEVRILANRNCYSNFIDVCEFPAFGWDRDRRISSLSVIAKNIYNQDVSGSVAEAGVYRGDFAKIINLLFPDRKLYLFDTFAGFDNTQVEQNMDNISQTNDWISTLKDTSEQLVVEKMKYKENVIVRKGLFPKTTAGIEDDFCFVNLDMDLYTPIYDGLSFFWPRMSPGGVIFVHDYDCWDGVTKAVLQFTKENGIGFICLNDGVTAAISKPCI